MYMYMYPIRSEDDNKQRSATSVMSLASTLKCGLMESVTKGSPSDTQDRISQPRETVSWLTRGLKRCETPKYGSNSRPAAASN